MFDKINIMQTAAVLLLGVSLVLSVFYGRENIALAIGGALGGYISGVATAEKGGGHEL